MPVPYTETNEGSEEQVAGAIAELSDDILAFEGDDEGGQAADAPEQPEPAAEAAEETDEPEGEAEAEAAADDEGDEPNPAQSEAEDDMVDLGEGQTVPLSALVEAYQNTQSQSAQIEQVQGQIAQQAQAKVEEIIQPLMQERQQLLQLTQTLQQAAMAIPDEPDPVMLDPMSDKYDPDKYHRDVASRNRAIKQSEQLSGLMQQQQQRLQQEQEYQKSNFARIEAAKLLDAWPEWQDENVQAEFVSGLEKHYQLDAETLSSIYDSRFYQVARDALEYRRLKSEGPKGAEKAPAKAKAAPKLIKGRKSAPGKPQDQKRQSSKGARDRLRKTGKLADAAAVFEQML